MNITMARDMCSETDDDTGGRAARSPKMAVVIYNNFFSFTTAHEIGHLFDLEHNREEFSGAERTFLDGKKAYGYLKTGLGEDFRTVMSYGNPPRLPFYSDDDMYYNSHLRGNYYAEAADYIRANSGDVTNYVGVISHNNHSGNILTGQIANVYGVNTVEMSNAILQPASRVAAHASQMVTLKPGFHVQNGAELALTFLLSILLHRPTLCRCRLRNQRK